MKWRTFACFGAGLPQAWAAASAGSGTKVDGGGTPAGCDLVATGPKPASIAAEAGVPVGEPLLRKGHVRGEGGKTHKRPSQSDPSWGGEACDVRDTRAMVEISAGTAFGPMDRGGIGPARKTGPIPPRSISA